MNKYTLPRGIVKACAGLVQAAADVEPYKSAIENAEAKIWPSAPAEQQAERQRLLVAIKRNLTSPRSPKIDALIAEYGLHISAPTFKRYKRRFCWEFAAALHLSEIHTGNPEKGTQNGKS